MRHAILVLPALALATTLDAAPSVLAGHRVHEKTFRILGDQDVTLHVTDAGPIPEESEKLRFIQAGQTWKRSVNGSLPRFHWSFGIELLHGARPTRIAIEDVTGKAAVAMTDDASPTTKQFGEGIAWFDHNGQDCDIKRDAPCAAMIFHPGPQWFVFKATVTFEDGSTDVLYQASAFDPDRMGPVFQLLDVDR